jgi:hypothetical protein
VVRSVWIGRGGGEGGRGKRTSVDEQHFDAEIGVTYAHQEDVFYRVVELEVVVPDVAHQLLDLGLEGALVGTRGEGLCVLFGLLLLVDA